MASNQRISLWLHPDHIQRALTAMAAYSGQQASLGDVEGANRTIDSYNEIAKEVRGNAFTPLRHIVVEPSFVKDGDQRGGNDGAQRGEDGGGLGVGENVAQVVCHRFGPYYREAPIVTWYWPAVKAWLAAE
jgi:hypothetical protein